MQISSHPFAVCTATPFLQGKKKKEKKKLSRTTMAGEKHFNPRTYICHFEVLLIDSSNVAVEEAEVT